MEVSNLVTALKPVSNTLDWDKLSWRSEKKELEDRNNTIILDWVSLELQDLSLSTEDMALALKIIDVCLKNTEDSFKRVFEFNGNTFRIKAEMKDGTRLGYSIALDSKNLKEGDVLYEQTKDKNGVLVEFARQIYRE